MPGDFFRDKDDKKLEKKKPELIDDSDELVATYNFENQKYQNTYDQSYDAILPIRHELTGGRDPQDIGMLNELRKHLQMSKIEGMRIGQKMYAIMDQVETLDKWSERYAEFLEGHIEAYQFLCESAVKIIENLYKEMEEMHGKVEEREEHIEQLTTEPGDIIIPPSEDRKSELTKIYKNLQTSLQFALLVNPKRDGKNLTPGERAYLKEINKELQRFKGTRRKEIVEEKSAKITKESTNLPKQPPEPPVYSPLSQNPKSETPPLKEEEKPQ